MRNSVLLLLGCLVTMGGFSQEYQQASPGYRYEFPRDHFNHPGYRTEWWYYTGNLRGADGRRYGFELTFFRQAVARDGNQSPWQVDDVYMAHLALTDVAGRRFFHDERLNRAGPGIAGIDEKNGMIWNGNWQAQIAPTVHTLRAVSTQFAIQLSLATAKPPVIQGRDGISRKAAGAGHASHYVSFTRLIASGQIVLDGSPIPIEGSAWMDHEFFSDSMDPTETGWDWVSLQLDDNTELMLYRLRHRDGSVDPFSSGSYVDAQGRCVFLLAPDFIMSPTGQRWTSPHTQGAYPIAWHIEVHSLGLNVDVTTPMPDQELPSRFGPSYWEGLIDVKGKRGPSEVHGVGYLEMTGYAAAMRY